MRVISCRSGAGETLGVVVGDRWLPATEVLDGGPVTMAELIGRGPATVAALRDRIAAASIADRGRPLGEADLLAPLPRPGSRRHLGGRCPPANAMWVAP